MNKSFASGALSICFLLLTGNCWGALIAGWDFQTTTNGGTAVLASPNTPRVFTSNFGSGTLYFDGSNGSSSWSNTAPTELNGFVGTALNTSGFGFSTTTTSPSSLGVVNTTANNKRAVFRFDMSGNKNLAISYAAQRTATGFTDHLWEYSTDGIVYNSIETVSSIAANFAVISLTPFSGLNDTANAFVRVTFTGASAPTGNNRLDNIAFQASAIPEPSSLVVVMACGVAGVIYRRKNRTGHETVSGGNVLASV